MMPSNHLILCCPLLPAPSIFPSIRVFSNESALSIRWPKYWSLSFSDSPSHEYSRLISFRIDWFDLFAAQGTLKSLFQHHSSKASISLQNFPKMYLTVLLFRKQARQDLSRHLPGSAQFQGTGATHTLASSDLRSLFAHQLCLQFLLGKKALC